MTQPWDRLRDGMRTGTVLGTFLKLPAIEVVEILAASLDFAVVDLEHSQLDDREARRLVTHGRALGFPLVVRVSSPDRERVNRMLEAGAAGIQLSTVRTADEIRDLRWSMRYAPDGNRSISLGHPGAGFGAEPLADYLAAQGDGPLLVAQIETLITEDPLEAIAAQRPDVLFVGPLDLTVDSGLDTDCARTRIDEIAGVAAAAGVRLGGAGVADLPVRYDVVGSDVALLRAGIERMATERKTA